MFDNPETQPTVAPATPAATPTPAAAAPETTATPATPAAIDVHEFELSLKQFGPDWSASNWKDKLAESRKTLSKQGNELAELKRRMQETEQEIGPLRKAIK